MKKYIILLRGINVSGKNKILMADLRNLLSSLKFQNVQTYIQSGNIILDSDKSKSEVCEIIKEGIQNNFGFDIPVIAKTFSELENAISSYPFSLDNEKIVAFAFLNKASEIKEIEIKGLKEDKYKIDEDLIYLYCPSGFGSTKLTNNIIEKKLNVISTSRNLRTVIKLLELTSN